jgi:hypothetical protein
MATAQKSEEIDAIEKSFDQAIDSYLEGAMTVNEEDIQRWLE